MLLLVAKDLNSFFAACIVHNHSDEVLFMVAELAVKGHGKGSHLHIVPAPKGPAEPKPKFPDLKERMIAHAQALGTPKGGPVWPDKYSDPKGANAAVNVLLCMELHVELKQMIKGQWLYTHHIEYGGYFPTVVSGTENAIILAMKALMKTDFEFVKSCLPHLILLHGKPDPEAWGTEPFSSEIKLVGSVVKQMLKEKYGNGWNLHTSPKAVAEFLQGEHVDIEGCFTSNWLHLPSGALSIIKHDMYEYLKLVMKHDDGNK